MMSIARGSENISGTEKEKAEQSCGPNMSAGGAVGLAKEANRIELEHSECIGHAIHLDHWTITACCKIHVLV